MSCRVELARDTSPKNCYDGQHICRDGDAGGDLYELFPVTAVDESGICVVNHDSGGIERGGSHHRWMKGGEGRGGYMYEDGWKRELEG